LLIDQLYKVADVLNTSPQSLLPSRSEIIGAARSLETESIPDSVHRFAASLRQNGKP
jgi:hypothetical protein